MKHTPITDLYQDQSLRTLGELTVCGWIRTLRQSKTISFLELNDGSCFKSLQVILTPEAIQNYEEITALSVGSAIVITGTIHETPEMRQPFELEASSAQTEGASSPEYPLQKKRHSLEYLRTISHLRPKTNTHMAVFRVRSRLALAIHQFFSEQGFCYVHTPIITASDAEGAGEMFRVTTLDPSHPPLKDDGTVDFKEDFFTEPTSLTVSGQIEGECLAMALGKIYTFGPTFRAERSNTTRHAAEFWMIEPEIAFADLKDDMELAQKMIKYVITDCLENCPDEMDFFNKNYDTGLIDRLQGVANSDFAEVTYTKAVELLLASGKEFTYPVSWGADLQTEHERYLTEEVFGRPVFVTDYPKEIKAFYMRMNDDQKTVAAVDLLVPGIGEIIGGSQREERLDQLLTRMAELELDPDDYNNYLDLRRFGTCRHAGFGLGFERLVMYVTGIGNIRDAIPFPRTTGSVL